MTAFCQASTRRTLSPWGTEVKKRLIDRTLKQDDLIDKLRGQGYSINRATLSNLLRGIGASNRQGEIEFISQFLGIPYVRREEQPGA